MYTNMHQQNNCQSLTNRSYGFKELAVLYFPNIAPASASIRLKQWIKDDTELLEALQETNYQLSNRILTPKQKELITISFGSPFKTLAQQLLRLQPEPSSLGERPAARGKSTSPDKRLPQRGTEGG